ncbi:Gfo/Idh/MocA family oxidoreductase [Actinopolymorpha sp. B11F2]|uniref:Gfo/Idh/MocA family protein n=1 Tax=Actinopolymorpha sp. B11F2 TaxID=3160862 RepID=UPI0032E48F41
MKIDSVRLGVIGCGRIAQVAHLPAVAKADGVQLVAVSDPSETLAHGVAARYGVTGCTDTGELLGHRLDAVLIAAPDRLHLPLGVQALEAGRHVLVEKPAADTATHAAELQARAESAGRKLQVGSMRRHDPGMAYAKAAMAELGTILTATSWYRIPATLRRPTEAALFPALVVDEDVRAREAGFKADRDRYLLLTHGAHVFDTLRLLVGELTNVRAQVAHHGRDYSWHGTSRLAGGGLVTFEISADVRGEYAEGIEIYGEHGHLSIRSDFPFFRHASRVRVHLDRTRETRTPEFGASDPYQRQVEAFARAIVTDAPTDPSGVDGAAALRLIEAVATSAAADGKEVEP